MSEQKTPEELKITDWYGGDKLLYCDVSFRIWADDWKHFENSKLFKNLKQYVEGTRSIGDIERKLKLDLSSMTVAEILRLQLAALAEESMYATAAELPGLTDAIIKVLQTKSQENYISYSGHKGIGIDGQPLGSSISHKGGSGDNV